VSGERDFGAAGSAAGDVDQDDGESALAEGTGELAARATISPADGLVRRCLFEDR